MTPEELTDNRAELIERYQHLTRIVMPEMAAKVRADWPVVNDHCFQRIVLDNVCGDVWYNHIDRPAYRNLTLGQAVEAVQLCEKIVAGATDLNDLNRRSLRWRGKAR